MNKKKQHNVNGGANQKWLYRIQLHDLPPTYVFKVLGSFLHMTMCEWLGIIAIGSAKKNIFIYIYIHAEVELGCIYSYIRKNTYTRGRNDDDEHRASMAYNYSHKVHYL